MSNKPKIYDITATGSTTSRDTRDRFSDVINVKDFGAVGDGITDDYEAIHAAIASITHGVIYFPHGTYCTSKTIVIGTNPTGRKVIDLGGSALRWIGTPGGLLMDIYGNSNGVMNGSLQGSTSDNVPLESNVADIILRLRGFWNFATNISVNWFRVSGIDIGADGAYDGVEKTNSIAANLENVNVSNSLNTIHWATEGGATGIRVYGFDNKFNAVTVLRCFHDVEIHSGGNRFVNCHLCEMTNSAFSEVRGDTASSAFYYAPDNSGRAGVNTMVNCYFDNHQIVIKNKISHNIKTTMDSCFYWCYDHTVTSPINKYIMRGKNSPIEILNFTEATNQYIMLWGARESVKFDTTFRDSCNEHYTTPVTSKNTIGGFWKPYLCRYRVQNHQQVLVTYNKELKTGDKYLIGGVMFTNRINLDYAATSFKVHVENGSFGGRTLQCDYNGYDNVWIFKDHTSHRSKLFDIAIGTPETVTIGDNTSIFVPIYIEIIGLDTSSNQISAWVEVSGADAVAYLVNANQTERPYTSTSFIDTSITDILLYYDVKDFNTLNTPGRFHVRFDSDTLNVPVKPSSALDCVLQVDLIGSATNVTTNRRTLQTATVINPTVSTSPTMWVRKGYGYPTTEWSQWFQVL